jgi:dynein heavy chain
MMGNPTQFLADVGAFNADDIEEWILKGLEPILKIEGFNQKDMEKKSVAASFLCSWIVNIVIYNTIFKKVKPLMDAAEAADALSKQKQEEQAVVDERVRVIKEKVAALNEQLNEAVAKKQAVEDDAQAKQDKLDLAQRLVDGLADENTRWKNNVQTFKKEKLSTIGDALLSAAFVSYIGPFTSAFRQELWADQWLNDINTRKIPITEGIDPLDVLASKPDQAGWNNEGLPADRMSLENASIVTSCKRYPLIIDPQLQGQKWIKGREGNDMTIIQLTQKNAIKKVEQAVTGGNILMIDSLSEEIDAVLDPILSRQIQKKGRGYSVKLGADDIDYDPSFKLYLQTKLINPHFKPETAAQCTIINFIVTESGLEDQLLAMVVRAEKSDLEQEKDELVNKQNEFQITLAKLEAELLENLSAADPATILDNKELVESLEVTKQTSTEIQRQQKIAKETELRINTLREVYRPVAAEGAMLYFLLIQLNIVAHMYQYSLKSFEVFFFKAIDKTETFEEEDIRVKEL